MTNKPFATKYLELLHGNRGKENKERTGNPVLYSKEFAPQTFKSAPSPYCICKMVSNEDWSEITAAEFLLLYTEPSKRILPFDRGWMGVYRKYS
jgi:hypothetical protein